MKKAFVILAAVALTVTLSSCGIVRGAVQGVNALRSARAELSQLASKALASEAPAEATEDAQPTQDDLTTQGAEETGAAEDTASPEANVQAGGADGWFTEIPDNIPVFSAGKLDKEQSYKVSIDQADTFYMQFAGVTKDQAASYEKALADAKFTNIKTEITGNYSVVGTLKKGDADYETVMMNWDQGSQVCMIVVMVKK